MSPSSEFPPPAETWQERAALYAAGSLTAEEREKFERKMEADPELAHQAGSFLEVVSQAWSATGPAIQQPTEKVRVELFEQLFPKDYPADFLFKHGFGNSDALVIADEWGQVTWINPAFSRMCGYSLAELRGKKAGVMLQGAMTDPATVKRIGAALRVGEQVTAKLWNYHKNGTPYEVELKISPLQEGGKVTGFIAVGQEIHPDFF